MTDIKKGDRVRVTTEVEILNPEKVRVHTLGNGGVYGYRALFQGIEVVVPADATIEKIEPPVEVFKPGDRLRRKSRLPYEVTLGARGYLHHATNWWTTYNEFDNEPEFFNSENFEKVLP